MKRLQIPQKPVYEKFYMHEKKLRKRNYRVNLSKVYFVKNPRKTSKPNNGNLNDFLI